MYTDDMIFLPLFLLFRFFFHVTEMGLLNDLKKEVTLYETFEVYFRLDLDFFIVDN